MSDAAERHERPGGRWLPVAVLRPFAPAHLPDVECISRLISRMAELMRQVRVERRGRWPTACWSCLTAPLDRVTTPLTPPSSPRHRTRAAIQDGGVSVVDAPRDAHPMSGHLIIAASGVGLVAPIELSCPTVLSRWAQWVKEQVGTR